GGAGVGGQGDERFLRRLVLGREGPDRLAVAVLLGQEGVLHRFTGVCFHVVGIDVDGVIERDLAEPHEALAERGLEVQAVLYGNVLEEAILSERRRRKGGAGGRAGQSRYGSTHRRHGYRPCSRKATRRPGRGRGAPAADPRAWSVPKTPRGQRRPVGGERAERRTHQHGWSSARV